MKKPNSYGDYCLTTALSLINIRANRMSQKEREQALLADMMAKEPNHDLRNAVLWASFCGIVILINIFRS